MKRSSIALLMAVSFLVMSCSSGYASRPRKEPHWFERHNADSDLLYVDRIDNSAVLQSADTAGSKTVFCSFRIGFVERLKAPAVRGSMLERGQYFQYRMQSDWKGLCRKDSVYPVFYESSFKRDPQTD